MVLWTIQPQRFLDALLATDRLRVPWEWVSRTWRPAYRWMVEQMQERGIGTDGHAPVWAWHSCEGWRRAPTRGTIEALVSHMERQGVVLTLEVPEEVAVLSVYGPWNDVLDLGLTLMRPVEFAARADELKGQVFDIPPSWNRRWGENNSRDIQACLPYVDRSWLVEVRPYTVHDSLEIEP